MPGTGTVYVDAKLSVIRQRAVGDGFSEELTILNHDEKPVDLVEVRIEAGSDFADLFEVKDALKKKGRYSDAGRGRPSGARLSARDVSRARRAISATAPAKIDEKGLTFRARIEPHGEWKTDLNVVTAVRRLGREPRPAEVLAGAEAGTRPNMERGSGQVARGRRRGSSATPTR